MYLYISELHLSILENFIVLIWVSLWNFHASNLNMAYAMKNLMKKPSKCDICEEKFGAKVMQFFHGL